SGLRDAKLGKGTLTTRRDRITCRIRDGSAFTILGKDVVAVAHDSQKNHMDWLVVWELVNPKGEALLPSFGTSLITIPIAVVGGAIVETLPAEQFVRIDWRENGIVEHVVLQTNKHKALLRELARIRNENGIDISAESERIRRELAN